MAPLKLGFSGEERAQGDGRKAFLAEAKAGRQGSTVPSRRPAHGQEWHPAPGWWFPGGARVEASPELRDSQPAPQEGPSMSHGPWAPGQDTGGPSVQAAGKQAGCCPGRSWAPPCPSPHPPASAARAPPYPWLWGGYGGASVLPASGRLSLLCSKTGVCPIFTFLEHIPCSAVAATLVPQEAGLLGAPGICPQKGQGRGQGWAAGDAELR